MRFKLTHLLTHASTRCLIITSCVPQVNLDAKGTAVSETKSLPSEHSSKETDNKQVCKIYDVSDAVK